MTLNIEFKESSQNIDLEFEQLQIVTREPEHYEGMYEIIPKPEAQILHTADKLMEHDITVKGIPKEYGLITYNQDKTLRIT